MASNKEPIEERYTNVFSASIPFYLWIAVVYVIFVVVAYLGGETMAMFGVENSGITEEGGTEPSLAMKLEAILDTVLFHIPLFSGEKFEVEITTLFIIFGFLAAWIEVLRATKTTVTGNDFMSLIVTIVSLVLFIGVGAFGTTAFMIVPLVGIGDLILDRYVGQAVARRDFGGAFGGHG